MKIHLIYLKDLVAMMEALEQVDSAAEFLYTKGPITVHDEGSQEFRIEWDADADAWCLNTNKSKDIK